MRKMFLVLSLLQMQVCLHCAVAAELPLKVKPLQGLTGLEVSVEGLSQDAKKIHITDKVMREIAAMKLQSAGIKVFSREERLRSPGMPSLQMHIILKVTEDGFVYGSTKIYVEEQACLTRQEMCGAFITWDQGSVFSVGIEKAGQFVKDSIGDDMDIFLRDYYAANPVKTTAGGPVQDDAGKK